MSVSREEVMATLSGHLQEMFEVPAAKITPGARLFEDLDLDSIDAVDLVVKLQEYTNRKMQASEFKTVRTVGDVVERVYAQLQG
jgi:acyl carrier protein